MRLIPTSAVIFLAVAALSAMPGRAQVSGTVGEMQMAGGSGGGPPEFQPGAVYDLILHVPVEVSRMPAETGAIAINCNAGWTTARARSSGRSQAMTLADGAFEGTVDVGIDLPSPPSTGIPGADVPQRRVHYTCYLLLRHREGGAFAPPCVVPAAPPGAGSPGDGGQCPAWRRVRPVNAIIVTGSADMTGE